ncbi:MaoC family dehydratase [Rubrobacter marinus]|nr:MaoC family dehydratase [Rubrobacter marinus]
MGATPEFKRQLREALGEMSVGQTYRFRRTFTDGDVAMFCGVTGDYNPYHQDAEFARESPYGQLTIPGLLTGSMLTHIGGLLGFLATEMSFEYLAPVFVGDTISCTVTVTAKDEERRRVECDAAFVNGDGKNVLRASFAGFPGRVRLAR